MLTSQSTRFRNLSRGDRTGRVVGVRGTVIDAEFTSHLPEINNELRLGNNQETVVEVLIQLDQKTVRGIALTPATEIARGDPIVDTGSSLSVPVGEALKGRMLNMFG